MIVIHWDCTLPTPAENLACDEALLDLCDAGAGPAVLRFWEPKQLFVVVGYANQVETEVVTGACQAEGVPVYRRCSGGGTVVQGPGCLNYALVLPLGADARLESVAGTNRFIMEKHREVLAQLLGQPVRVEGFTDLAIGSLKFSGNAQRRKRRAVLFHGSFLLNLDLTLMERCLRLPAKQPAYRQNRRHAEFVTNLGLPATTVKAALRRCWEADRPLDCPPQDAIEILVRSKYSQGEWNFRR